MTSQKFHASGFLRDEDSLSPESIKCAFSAYLFEKRMQGRHFIPAETEERMLSLSPLDIFKVYYFAKSECSGSEAIFDRMLFLLEKGVFEQEKITSDLKKWILTTFAAQNKKCREGAFDVLVNFCEHLDEFQEVKRVLTKHLLKIEI